MNYNKVNKGGNIMYERIQLIDEINHVREEIKTTKNKMRKAILMRYINQIEYILDEMD